MISSFEDQCATLCAKYDSNHLKLTLSLDIIAFVEFTEFGEFIDIDIVKTGKNFCNLAIGSCHCKC